MKAVLSGLAANREAACAISSGLETALDGFADAEILILNAIADGDTLVVVGAGGVADVGEIEIENYAAVIGVDGDDEVGVEIALVAIEHEVGIEPEIPGTVALAGGDGGGVFGGGSVVSGSFLGDDHGAGLQAVAIFVFDGVALVVENGLESLVEVGDVVAAVEIVVDEDLPVAGDVIAGAGEVVELAETEGRDAAGERAEEVGQGRGGGIEIDEEELLPDFDVDGDEAILLAVEIFDALKFGRAFERTIEAVIPSVVGAVKDGGLAAGIGDDGSGVMAADVVEGAQDAVMAADGDDGLTCDSGGEELAGMGELIDAADGEPVAREDGMALEFGDARVGIPGRGDGGGLGERGLRVVAGEDGGEGCGRGESWILGERRIFGAAWIFAERVGGVFFCFFRRSSFGFHEL